MSQETFMRLEQLRKLNSDRQWVNHNVYRLMYKEDLYILAYERIKSKSGNRKPATGFDPIVAVTGHYENFAENGQR
jgi:hypothetical protein